MEVGGVDWSCLRREVGDGIGVSWKGVRLDGED